MPGDKSISHRALLLGAIADGTSRVENYLSAADCLATLRAVRALGVKVQEMGPTVLRVHGRGLRGLREPEDVLDCTRSGTTMRLLAGLLAGQRFFSVVTGDAQLRRRPMGRVVEPLRLMGATVSGRDGGRKPPLAFQGGDLQGLDYALPVASAQVKSALLLAGLYADGSTTLHVPGPARDHTERMLLAMGCNLETAHHPQRNLQHGVGTKHHHCLLTPTDRLQPFDLTVPGDLSSAAFLIVAATLVPGSEITLEGVGVNPTRTGLLDVLEAMGAAVTLEDERIVSGEPVADLTVRASELQGTEVGGYLVVRMIDEFPILAVAATQAHGETIVRDAAELRVKETDRIATVVQELRYLGAEIEPRPDGFVVQGPTPLHEPEPLCAERDQGVEGVGTSVNSHGDHRLAMALVVAGLTIASGIQVQDVTCIEDSFPGFASAVAGLGGQIT